LDDTRVVASDRDDHVWMIDARGGQRVGDATPLVEATRLVASHGRAVALRGWSMTPLAPPGPPEEVCEAPHNLITVALGATRDVALCDDRLVARSLDGAWETLPLSPPAGDGDGRDALRPTAIALSPRGDRVAVADERGRAAVI